MKATAKILIAALDEQAAQACEKAVLAAQPDGFVRLAPTPEAFASALKAITPDIVIAPWQAKAFGALAAATYLHTRDPDAAVIAMADAPDRNAVMKMLDAGIVDVVPTDGAQHLLFALPHALADVERRRKRRRDARAMGIRLELAKASEDGAREGILTLDRRGQIVTMNPSFTAMWDIPAGMSRGASSRVVIDALRDRLSDSDAFLSVLRGEGQNGHELVHRWLHLKNGRTFDARATAIRDPAVPEETLGHAWFFRDVTQSDDAEGIGRKNEDLLRALTDQEVAGTIIFDRQGTVLYVNPKFAHMLGYAVEDVVGRSFLDFIREGVRTETQGIFQSVASGKAASAPVSTQIIEKSGGTVDIIGQWTAGTYEGKGAIIGVAVDVTALNRTKAALLASEELYRTVFSVMGEGILVIDRKGKIITCNDAAAQLLGYSPQEIEGQSNADPRWDMVDRDGKPLPRDEYPSSLALGLGKPVNDLLIGFRRADGELRWLVINAQPLFEVGVSEPHAAVLSFSDITSHKLAEDTLRRVNHALKVLGRANEVVVRAANEQELLDQMCQALVDTGGYRLAGIGLRTMQATPLLRAAACADAASSVPKLTLRDCDAVGSQPVIEAAMAEGKMRIDRDLAIGKQNTEDPMPTSGARIILPLGSHAASLGVLVLYADKPDTFTDDEESLLAQLADNLVYGIESLRERQKIEGSEKRLRRAMEAAVQAIASTLEMRDPYTAGHQREVARLAVAISHELELPEDEIEGIYLAAIVHDIGKIRIPIDILSKPGPLTHLEYQLIQTHAQIGYDIMKYVDFPWPVAQMILQHHERLDGSGYPAGLRGDEILEGAKIIAVADVVQAMSMRRPYRGAFGEAVALEEITRGRGRLYDPAAVDACLKLFHDKGFRFA